jgi:hypothetical protein
MEIACEAQRRPLETSRLAVGRAATTGDMGGAEMAEIARIWRVCERAQRWHDDCTYRPLDA